MNPMKTTRRTLLAALAASTAAAASSASPEAAEALELVQLADRIEPALTAYKDAAARVERIKAEWQPKAPALPTVIRPDGFEDGIICFANGSRRYTDITEKPIPVQRTKTWTQVVDLGTAESFEANAAAHFAEADRKSKTKSQRGMKQELRWAESDAAKVGPARQYWAEFDRVVEVSGIKAAQKAEVDAREALRTLVGEIIGYEERTVTGLVIKAEAMAAWMQVERFYILTNLDGAKWSQHISETILRQVAA